MGRDERLEEEREKRRAGRLDALRRVIAGGLRDMAGKPGLWIWLGMGADNEDGEYGGAELRTRPASGEEDAVELLVEYFPDRRVGRLADGAAALAAAVDKLLPDDFYVDERPFWRDRSEWDFGHGCHGPEGRGTRYFDCRPPRGGDTITVQVWDDDEMEDRDVDYVVAYVSGKEDYEDWEYCEVHAWPLEGGDHPEIVWRCGFRTPF